MFVNNKRKGKIWLGVGVLAAVGSVVGYLYWKSQKIDSISEPSFVQKKKQRATLKVPKKATKSLRSKLNRSEQMLAQLEIGKDYTQIEIQKATGIPYRSVRRYVNELVSQNLLKATGYGKGKRFRRLD